MPIRASGMASFGPTESKTNQRRDPHQRQSKSRGRRPDLSARNVTRRHWTMTTIQFDLFLIRSAKNGAGLKIHIETAIKFLNCARNQAYFDVRGVS